MRRAMAGHWGVLWTSVTAALVSAAAVATIPLLVGNAVNEGLVAHRWARFGTYVGIVAVLGVVQALASGSRRWFNGVASPDASSPRYGGASTTTCFSWTWPTTRTSIAASCCPG